MIILNPVTSRLAQRYDGDGGSERASNAHLRAPQHQRTIAKHLEKYHTHPRPRRDPAKSVSLHHTRSFNGLKTHLTPRGKKRLKGPARKRRERARCRASKNVARA